MNTQQQEKLQRHLGYLAKDKTNGRLMLTISGIYRELNDNDNAERYLSDAKTLLTQALIEKDNAMSRYQLAFCLYSNHHFNDALVLLNALDNHLLSNEAALLKAKILHHLEQPDEAMVILEALVITESANAEVAGLLALLHFDNNALERADFLSKHALSINAADSNGQLVQMLLKTLSNNITIEDIKSRLTIMPEESRLWFALGTTEMRAINFHAAEIAFAEATQKAAGFYDGWISLGWCYLLQDKLEQAEKTYQQAVVIDAENADGFGGLALVNALRGNNIEAKKWLAKTLLLDSECFLAKIAQTILANSENKAQAVAHLNAAVPGLKEEINHLLAAAILNIGKEV